MKKVLLIGFQKYDDDMYPHLKCIIDKLSLYTDLKYFFFHERGYFVQDILERPFSLRTLKRVTILFIYTLMDSIRLKIRFNGFDKIIVIDHYAFAIASLIFRHKPLILWSHDIISKDNRIYNNVFVKYYMKLCSKALVSNRKVIIQDLERLSLLQESLNLTDINLDVFLMPVVLEKQNNRDYREISSYKRPRLIQCGGIGAYRLSNLLLEHYQQNSGAYRLYFHGFIFPEIVKQLKKCPLQPMVSSQRVQADHLPQIIDYGDIGFIGYQPIDKNFFYIAYASNQLTEFLRIGMPVIVIGDTNMLNFVKQNNIGVAIKDFSELNAAINYIVNNYRLISDNCFICFDKYFCHEKYINSLVDWL